MPRSCSRHQVRRAEKPKTDRAVAPLSTPSARNTIWRDGGQSRAGLGGRRAGCMEQLCRLKWRQRHAPPSSRRRCAKLPYRNVATGGPLVAIGSVHDACSTQSGWPSLAECAQQDLEAARQLVATTHPRQQPPTHPALTAHHCSQDEHHQLHHLVRPVACQLDACVLREHIGAGRMCGLS